MWRPPGANWPKFENRVKIGRLVGYKGNSFYQILIPNGNVQRYSHMVWLNDDNNKRRLTSPPPIAYKFLVSHIGRETMARIQPIIVSNDKSNNGVEGEPPNL